jgi:hypothetical protein
MDLTVLNLAVPHLSADLRPSSSQLPWIVDIYGLLFLLENSRAGPPTVRASDISQPGSDPLENWGETQQAAARSADRRRPGSPPAPGRESPR